MYKGIMKKHKRKIQCCAINLKDESLQSNFKKIEEEKISYLRRFIFYILISFFVHFTLSPELSFAKLTIATGSKGGNYYPVGEKIAEILNQNIQGLSVDVKTTQGSVENLKLLEDGESELAIVQSDILHRSYFGDADINEASNIQGVGIKKVKNLKGIIALFPEYIQVVVRKEDFIIKNIRDLSERKVSLGRLNSGAYKNAVQLLKISGVDQSDIRGFTDYSPEESVDMVINGTLDAAFLTQGSILINKKGYSDKLKLLSFNKSTLDKLIELFPYYSQTSVEIDETSYRPRLPFVRAVLVAKDITNEQAYNITKALYENWNDLYQVNAKMNTYIDFFNDKSLARKIAIPLHHSSKKFYTERGLMFRDMDYYILLLIFCLIGFTVLFIKTMGKRLEKMVASNHFFEKSLNLLNAITSKKIAVVVWAFALIFSMDILLIKKMEASYSFYNDIPSPFENLSFGDTLLWLLTYAVTGYTQGIFPISNLGKIFSIIIPFLGIGGIFVGIILFTNKQFQNRDLEKRGLRVKYLKNHIIICGWNVRVPDIIRILTGPYVPVKKKIVVVAEMDDEYPLEDFKFNPNYVFYCRGYSSSYETLEKVHLRNADKVLVMAGQKKIANENIRSILTVLAVKNFYRESVKDKEKEIPIFAELIRRLMILTRSVLTVLRVKNFYRESVKDKEKEIPIFAELLFQKNKEYFDQADVDKLISLDVIRAKFCAAACVNNGVTDLLLDILTHNERDDLYSIFIKDLKKPIKEKVIGKTFSDILNYLRTKNVLLLAIYKHIGAEHKSIDDFFVKKSPYIINPTNEERDYKVVSNDKLIYIAAERDTIQEG